MRALKAQMRATRFGLESRLGRQLAHDDPFLMWIPTFAGDTIARFRKGPDGKTPWERDSLEFGERFFMKEAKERGSGVVKKDWEPRLIEARYLGQHAWTGALIGITADGIVPKQSVGIRQVGRISKEFRGIFDRRACQCWRSMLRLSQALQRPKERAESFRPRDEAPRGGVQEERAAAAPASASDAAETEPSAYRTRGGDTRAREFYVVRKDVNRFGPTARRQDALMCRWEFQ